MSLRPATVLACLLLALAAAPAGAETHRVDDSASQVLQGGPLKMRWDSLVPQPGQPATMTGEVVVLVRLDVSAWQGRTGRIYHVLPALPSGPVTVRWSTQGSLLPGVLRDGERTLVYSGPITTPRLEDTFRMTIQADGDRVLRPQDLVFSFEIELESP